MNRTLLLGLLIAITPLALPAATPAETATRPHRLKLATAAPRGSSFHKTLDEMGKEWRAENVELTIYAGGVRGGEAETIQLMRNGALDAALVSGIGLGTIDPSAEALQSIPLLFQSLDEFDYAAGKLRPRLERNLRQKGFVVLFWSDVGWVRVFSKQPVLRPDDLRRLELFTWAGDVPVVDLYKANGFRPVPLETNDILPALQTGMIDAVPMPPAIALMTQVFTHAPYMLELDWAPLLGALVVTEKSWDKLPPESQRALARAAAEAGRRMNARNRIESEAAVTAMRKRNLRVTTPSPAIEAEWRALAEKSYQKLRGRKIPAELFDEITCLVAEYRRSNGGAR